MKSVLSRQAIDAGWTRSGFHPWSPSGPPPLTRDKQTLATTEETIPLQGLLSHAPGHFVSFLLAVSSIGVFSYRWSTFRVFCLRRTIAENLPKPK